MLVPALPTRNQVVNLGRIVPRGIGTRTKSVHTKESVKQRELIELAVLTELHIIGHW